jgi:hypothetical protein
VDRTIFLPGAIAVYLRDGSDENRFLQLHVIVLFQEQVGPGKSQFKGFDVDFVGPGQPRLPWRRGGRLTVTGRLSYDRGND